MAAPPFDALRTTAVELSEALTQGSLTSVEIVKAYLNQIEKHNRAGLELQAIISVAPREIVLTRAEDLDQERRDGLTRGPLHSIPIIVKDAFMTAKDLGMPTTAGAVAFKHSFARHNAPVIENLLDQGMIILGKASMTEFCGLKATNMTTGWCAVNGLTQSAWIKGGVRKSDIWYGRSTPGGSSSGSGVGVSAGFAPLSLATETSGSICMPANRAGLYSMKATLGTVSTDGVFPLGKEMDGIGGMAKCSEDLALLMTAINGSRFDPAASKTWKDVSVGFVDPKVWFTTNSKEEEVNKQIITEYEWAMSQLRQRGATVAYPVSVVQSKNLNHNDKSVMYLVSFQQFPSLFRIFCTNYVSAPVSTVNDLIAFNSANASRAMPPPHTDQTDLIATTESKLSAHEADELLSQARTRASESIDAALNDHGIDVIIGPGDCPLCTVAALAGYPTAMVPLGVLESEEGMGQPQGLMVIAGKDGEGAMLRFMKLWEQDVVGRAKVPVLLREAGEGLGS